MKTEIEFHIIEGLDWEGRKTFTICNDKESDNILNCASDYTCSQNPILAKMGNSVKYYGAGKLYLEPSFILEMKELIKEDL